MSWDIFLFNTNQKVEIMDELDEDIMEPIDFCSIFKNYFNEIEEDEDHRSIKGVDFTIEYFIDDVPTTTKILNLYGENALYEIILLAQKYQWQIFDTSLGGMVDVDNPQRNGYENFGQYLHQITNKNE